MSKFKPQYRRLLFIDARIRSGRYPNCPALAAEWEVSAKTIQRDIDYLRDELDAPIEYDRQRNGYTYTENSYRLPTVPISESDLFAVCIAAEALRQFENTPLHTKLASVFDKIRESLPAKLKVNPAWIDERILIFPEPATTIATETWDTVAAALAENRRLRIDYRTPGAARHGSRPIDPYYLVSYRGEWYVTGYCHRRDAIRTFALSRIHRAEVLGETFVMPDLYDVDTMFGDRFGIHWQEQRQKVRIRFGANVAPFIRERRWHPLQRIEKQTDGSLILAFATNHITEVKTWVLSWGAAARVLEPASLAKDIAGELRAAAAAYPGAGSQ